MQAQLERMDPASLRRRFEDALESLVSKLKQDRYILAAILCGSLSYDEVWEKSDIDMILIGSDEKYTGDWCLTENGINIHASLIPRSKFKIQLEGGLQSSFFHSLISKSRLLFSTDETIEEYYHDIQHIGARDREIQLLRAGSSILGSLAKAEKWYLVKKDMNYSFLWIMFTVEGLARIEATLHGEIVGREVIHQALRLNPAFFKTVYTDLIQGPKDEQQVGQALRLINEYLDEKIDILYKPILDYLKEAHGVRSTTEIDTYFKKRAQTGGLAFAYEWLADKEVIRKVPTPLRLTEKSKITVDEAAYYYDGGDNDIDSDSDDFYGGSYGGKSG